jgi:ATP-dependent DNA helicase RecG
MINQGLPFNLDDLINLRAIEGNRVEFKATWDDYIKPAVVRTICAFANDLLNLNGGYIILGIEENQGRPQLPPRGLDDLDLDLVQKEIRGACIRIDATYQPVLFPAVYQGESILVIWAPGSDNRPHQAPENINVKGSPLKPYIRQGPQTVEAKGEFLRQLMEAAAKVPFDDRKNLTARVEDISPTLVRRFLHDIRSDLALSNQPVDDLELYRKLRIVLPVNGHEVPKNIGLLFFNEDPDRLFPGARIEVVEFGDDAGGNLIEERTFRGPLPQQIRATLQHLDTFGGTLLRKISGQAEAERTVAYPYEAMEEAIVNAVYHRGYDGPPEPVKVYLYPDRMEIISYPGPPPGIQPEHFAPGQTIPPVPARNRRIGEMLKELRLAEGRGTGIPKIQRKMLENGSPAARFDLDEARTYFRVTLPAHPRYQALYSLREAAHLWAIGEKPQAVAHLRRSFDKQPTAGAIASQLIEYAVGLNDLNLARRALTRFEASGETRNEAFQPYLTLARLLIDRNQTSEALGILKRAPLVKTARETTEAAILKKRAGDFEGAHRLFAEAYSINPNDPQIIQEYAQTKIHLSKEQRERIVKLRLTREAVEMFRKAIQLTDDPARKAWCWYDLAKSLDWLGDPQSDVEAAFLQAQALLPHERRFQDAYREWQRRAAHPSSKRHR